MSWLRAAHAESCLPCPGESSPGCCPRRVLSPCWVLPPLPPCWVLPPPPPPAGYYSCAGFCCPHLLGVAPACWVALSPVFSSGFMLEAGCSVTAGCSLLLCISATAHTRTPAPHTQATYPDDPSYPGAARGLLGPSPIREYVLLC